MRFPELQETVSYSMTLIPGVVLELYILLGLEGAGVLLVRLHLLEELGILGLDVPGSVKGLVCLEG